MSPVNYAARISKAYSRDGIFSLVYIFSDLVSSYPYRIASGPLTWPKVVMSTDIPLIGFHDRASRPPMGHTVGLDIGPMPTCFQSGRFGKVRKTAGLHSQTKNSGR